MPGKSSIFALVALFLFGFAADAAAYYDPPSQPARLSYVRGDVSFQSAGRREWRRAYVNRTLSAGDRLWLERRARTEIRIGSAAIRAEGSAAVSFLNLEDGNVQLGLRSGTLHVRLRHLPRGEEFEVDTPDAAITFRRAGDYRIDVDSRGEMTLLSVRDGEARIEDGRRAYRIRAGRQVEIFSTRRGMEYDVYDLPPEDSFDEWCRERDRRMERSRSSRYMSVEVTGYEDLDDHGSWRSDSRYGAIWLPERVSHNWAPFRDGRWNWVDPWGWTWVDDHSWGYATSHYGRWVYLRHLGWAWVPPQRHRDYHRPVYSPANVVFLHQRSSGRNGIVAWFPLAPGEAYVPSYRASRDYVRRLNATNTYGDYDRYDGRSRHASAYSNRNVAGAVIAVAGEAFASAQPVSRSAVDARAISDAQVTEKPPVTPAADAAPAEEQAAATHRPPREVESRRLLAKKRPRAAARQDASPQQESVSTPPPAFSGVEVLETVAEPEVIEADEPRQKDRGNREHRRNQRKSSAQPPAGETPAVAAPPATQTQTEEAAPETQDREPRRGNRDKGKERHSEIELSPAEEPAQEPLQESPQEQAPVAETAPEPVRSERRQHREPKPKRHEQQEQLSEPVAPLDTPAAQEIQPQQESAEVPAETTPAEDESERDVRKKDKGQTKERAERRRQTKQLEPENSEEAPSETKEAEETAQ